MKKLTSLLMLALFLFTGLSMKAQTESSTGWYAPGARLGIDEIEVGTDVFIYSMCRVNGTGDDYSRFIINSNNSAAAYKAKPATFKTQDNFAMWKVRSKDPVYASDQTTILGYKLTFSRKRGSEGTVYYWGIGGGTDNTQLNDARQFVVTQWLSAPCVNGSSKSGTDVYAEADDGTAVAQSSLTSSDKVYLMSALSGKSVNTQGGSYQTNKNNGYPVAFYAIQSNVTAPEPVLNGLTVSTAPTTSWDANTKWYTLKINRGNYRFLETTSTYCDESGKLKIIKNVSSNGVGALWAVTGDINNGYKFYNYAAGTSMVLGVTGSENNARYTMVDASTTDANITTTFDIAYDSNGWYIKKHRSIWEYVNCREPYLGLWNTSDALGNTGSCAQFMAVDDLETYLSTANVLSRYEAWTHVPALWPTASEVYNTLNSALSAESATEESKQAAIQTAGEAFVAALNGVRFTAQNRGNGDRSSRFLSIGSSSCVGVIPDYSMDEVLTIKPNTDGSFKIYGENSGKYIRSGSNSVSAVDLASAEDFYLQTSAFGVTAVENVGGFHLTSHATNLLHLHNYQNGGTTENPMTVYGFGDAASRWLLSTDVSRHDLKPAIANATAWKNNLETLINNLVAAKKISVKPTSLGVTLPVAITKAQSAYDSGEGTKVALSALNAALTKAQGAWLGELGTAQQFRFKMSDGTKDYYLTTGFPISYADGNYVNDDSAAGNARLITPLDESNKNQLFTLVPGAETGKYILQSCADGNLQLTNIGGWNTEMSASGSAYKFEEVDLTVPTFKLNTGVASAYGDQQGRFGTDEATLANDIKLFTNKSVDDSYVTWTLEFVAPTLSETLDMTSLQATYNKQNFVKDNSLNFVNQNAPSIKTYESVREEARKVITGNVDAGITLTQIDVNTAEAELKAAYSQMLNNFISEADPTQGYLLQFYSTALAADATPLYLTFNTGEFNETYEVNALQLKERSAATQQNAQFVSAGSDNSFYIVEGFNKKKVSQGSLFWNPMLKDNGVAYTIEFVTLDGIDGLVARLRNPQGILGPGSTTPAANAYLYTNQTNTDLYFILKPTVSPDLVITLYNLIADAERYEGHVGTGVGKYIPAGGLENVDDATLVSYNDSYMSFINGTEKTNSGIKSVIDNVYNTMIFPFTINQPTPGKLYRFKGKKSGKYMASASSSTRNKMVLNEEAANGLETVFKLVEDGGNYKLLNCGNGYFITNTHDASALKANANTITFNASESSYIGYYTIKTNYSSPYIFDDKTDNEVDRNSSYAADNCDWQIEEVTELPVPINTTVGYGTLYSPVPLKGVSSGNYDQDGRLEFYYGKKEGDKLKLTKIDGDIPAETGLIVKYKGGVNEATGCVFMEIADTDPEFTADNELTGTLETVAKPTTGTVYTLQKPADSPLGLYNFTGTHVKGGKAYYLLAEGAAAPMGFVFDFDGVTTGVENIEVNADNQVIYDLSGRRVAKAGKGLYIINGKKVLVK